MPNDNGKVIVSLLAGATAGIVAGLLLAPETGDDTRAGLRASARRWAGRLGKLAQDALAQLPQDEPAGGPNLDARVRDDRAAADRLFDNMSRGGNTGAAEPGDLSAPVGAGDGRSLSGDDDYGHHHRADLDYDGDAGDGRHRPL